MYTMTQYTMITPHRRVHDYMASMYSRIKGKLLLLLHLDGLLYIMYVMRSYAEPLISLAYSELNLPKYRNKGQPQHIVVLQSFRSVATRVRGPLDLSAPKFPM